MNTTYSISILEKELKRLRKKAKQIHIQWQLDNCSHKIGKQLMSIGLECVDLKYCIATLKQIGK